MRCASNGQVALDLIDEAPPDLILLDLLMPVMDGREFAQAYHMRPGPHARIILLTATFDSGVSALQISADAYLDKPFMLEDLLDVIERTLALATPACPSP